MTEPRECIRACLRADGTARPAADGTALCRPDLLRLDEWLGGKRDEGSIAWTARWLMVCYTGWPMRAVEVLTAITKGDPPAPSSAAILDTLGELGRQTTLAVRLLCELRDLHGPDGLLIDDRLRWLRAHAHDLASAPFAGHLWDGFARLMSQAHALAPWRPVPARHEGVPCPECLAPGALVTAPPIAGTDPDTGRPKGTGGDTAWCQACGFGMTAGQLDRWVGMAAAHYRPRSRGWTDPASWDGAARALTPRPEVSERPAVVRVPACDCGLALGHLGPHNPDHNAATGGAA